MGLGAWGTPRDPESIKLLFPVGDAARMIFFVAQVCGVVVFLLDCPPGPRRLIPYRRLQISAAIQNRVDIWSDYQAVKSHAHLQHKSTANYSSIRHGGLNQHLSRSKHSTLCSGPAVRLTGVHAVSTTPA